MFRIVLVLFFVLAVGDCKKKDDNDENLLFVAIALYSQVSKATEDNCGNANTLSEGSNSVSTPTFSPSSGYYTSPQKITISSTTNNAKIYYTMNGTIPTASSSLYNFPIHIWSLAGKSLKAFASLAGADSGILTGNYCYPPLRTGQTNVYATGDNGTNQNGIQRDYTGPTQSTLFPSDYTTTDNATGLIWRTCSQGLSGATCATGSAVTLAWDNASTDALNGCNALNLANGGTGYAGKKTWRLPSIEELGTLPDFSRTFPAINISAFPGTVSTGTYWSSTVSPNTLAYDVLFSVGGTGVSLKSSAYNVRCVTLP
jgi:hypothetical protein